MLQTVGPNSLPPVSAGNLGERIRVLREARGWTRTELARRLYGDDVSRLRYKYVHRWEEQGMDPDVETIRRLAEVFGVTLDELAGTMAGQDPPFEAWRAFVASPRGQTMTPEQRRTLAGIPWRGMEPTVEAYSALLLGLELARRTT